MYGLEMKNNDGCPLTFSIVAITKLHIGQSLVE